MNTSTNKWPEPKPAYSEVRQFVPPNTLPKPSPPHIGAAIDRLLAAIDTLDKTLMELTEHLGPVLLPQEVPLATGATSPSPSGSPIHCIITELTDKINHLISRTNNLNSRIDL